MTQENEKGTKLLVALAEAAQMLKADPSLGERSRNIKTYKEEKDIPSRGENM